MSYDKVAKSYIKLLTEATEEHPMIEVDGIMKHRHNSLGQPIHHTDEGIRNFHRWFGDSKTVDAHGRPLVVYHGTGASIHEFSNRNNRLSWASEQSDLANRYAEVGENPHLLPVFTTIKNPVHVPPVGNKMTPKELGNRIGIKLPESLGDDIRSVYRIINTPEFVESAKNSGHDGIFGYEAGRKTWATFNPHQIKSAIGNSGAFSHPTKITESVYDAYLRMVLNSKEQ